MTSRLLAFFSAIGWVLMVSCASISNVSAPVKPAEQVVKDTVPAVVHQTSPEVATPSPEPVTSPINNDTKHPTIAPTAEEKAAVHQRALYPLAFQTLTRDGITFHILSFDTSEYQLKVADQVPGKSWTSAQEAAQSTGGVAAINGGFFGTNGQPLGAVISGGKSSGSWNTGSSLTSGVYQLSGKSASIVRNSRAHRGASELLQTGPFLLENNQPVSGLSSTNPARRSFLLWDGGNHMSIVQSSVTTLSKLAEALTKLPETLPKKTALNLDGGRSCDLFVSEKAHKVAIQRGHWLRSDVRNYLVLTKN